MTEFSKLEKGNILSEAQYYVVEKVANGKVQLKTDGGSVIVDEGYVEEYLNSAEQFTTTEPKTKTELAELFISKPRIAMTVCFLKQDKKKTKKAYNADLQAEASKVQIDFLASGISAIEKALANPVLDYIPGEVRPMKGRHYGIIDDLGRVIFTDMEITSEHNSRQVDPRTIQYLIVEGVKYELKK